MGMCHQQQDLCLAMHTAGCGEYMQQLGGSCIGIATNAAVGTRKLYYAIITGRRMRGPHRKSPTRHWIWSKLPCLCFLRSQGAPVLRLVTYPLSVSCFPFDPPVLVLGKSDTCYTRLLFVWSKAEGHNTSLQCKA